jgi:hypothetical protein
VRTKKPLPFPFTVDRLPFTPFGFPIHRSPFTVYAVDFAVILRSGSDRSGTRQQADVSRPLPTGGDLALTQILRHFIPQNDNHFAPAFSIHDSRFTIHGT